MHKKIKPRRILLILFIVITILLAGLTGLYLYVQFNTYPATEEKVAMINDHPELNVTENRSLIIIKPVTTNDKQPAIIFYPGGLVAPEAYLYKMGQLADCLNTTIYLVKPPFNAAIFAINAATKVIADYGLENVWVGGHSLGGIAAARFTTKNPNTVSGLFLLGSYSDLELTFFQGQVISIMGLNDLIINRSNYEGAKTNLPPNTKFIEIEGLNHSGFGNYGLQKNDGPISLTDQEINAIICSAFQVNRTSK